MAISKELLEILACPKCKGDIYLNEAGASPGVDTLGPSSVSTSIVNPGLWPTTTAHRQSSSMVRSTVRSVSVAAL